MMLASMSVSAGNSSSCATHQESTGLETRLLAHEISAGKRRRGAFETDLALYRFCLWHQINQFRNRSKPAHLFRSSSATVAGVFAVLTAQIVFAIPLVHDFQRVAERTGSRSAGKNLTADGYPLPRRPSTTFQNFFPSIWNILGGSKIA
jgi:hypothetical protein